MCYYLRLLFLHLVNELLLFHQDTVISLLVCLLRELNGHAWGRWLRQKLQFALSLWPEQDSELALGFKVGLRWALYYICSAFGVNSYSDYDKDLPFSKPLAYLTSKNERRGEAGKCNLALGLICQVDPYFRVKDSTERVQVWSWLFKFKWKCKLGLQ